MKYQEFIEIVKDYMKDHVPTGHRVVIQPVLKNNGTTYDGLIIIDPILNISPTIYLNPYYHRYLNGVSISDIFEDILQTYHENKPFEDFDISVFKDFSKAKERIVVKLVNYKKNKELLLEIPHIQFHDLALIFVCSVSDFLDEYATILIHNQHLNMWGVSLEELYQIGMKNSPEMLPCRYERMEDYFERIMDNPFPFLADLHMYLLTNQIKIHGATCMVYPGLLKELADKLQDNLIIIPSSIHEVLILPEKSTKGTYTLADLKNMVCEANDTQLTDDEVLSDHAYLYIRETGELHY